MGVTSLSRSELPEEIEKAIDALVDAEHNQRAKGYLDADAWCEAAKACNQAREALTAAILSRLGEAEARREEAERKVAWLEWMLNRIAFDTDGSARKSDDGHDWPALVREALEVRDPVLMPAITAERDAALARVESLEKALGTAQSALAMLTEPNEIRSTSVANAWAVAVDAEMKCRLALSEAPPQGDR